VTVSDVALGVDATSDAPKKPACNSSTCATGCCDADGVCQAGTSSQSCGGAGGKCVTCVAPFMCQPAFGGHVCLSKGNGTQCSYANCPSGCCARLADVSQDLYCFQGDGDYACGVGGQECADCVVNQDTCANHQCSKAVCGGGHCQDGCCLGSECLSGTDLQMCGTGAKACADCSKSGETCQQQQCKPALCTTKNCSGCCVGDICATGTQDNACGTGGVTCVDCTSSKKACSSGSCQ